MAARGIISSFQLAVCALCDHGQVRKPSAQAANKGLAEDLKLVLKEFITEPYTLSGDDQAACTQVCDPWHDTGIDGKIAQANATNMSQPPTREEILARVHQETLDNFIIAAPSCEYNRWVTRRFQEYEDELELPHLRNMTLEEFHLYNIRVRDIKLQAAIADSIPTEEQFWQAAYDYPESKLVDYLASGRVGPITIGKLYGETILKLLPSIGVLSAAPLDQEPSFDFAATDSGAIYCPDGHPTERILFSTSRALPPTSHQMACKQNSGLIAAGASLGASPKPSVREIQPDQQIKRRSRELSDLEICLPSRRSPSPQADVPSSSQAMATPTIGAQRDDKLRRCAALGWIIMEKSPGNWKRTGHVMVIDMDDRNIRQRQPWLILAPEWPTDGDELPDGTFTHHADEIVDRDDKSVAGVLPGDKNRTTICCIRPQDPVMDMSGQPVLQCFGPGFKFNLVRLGGHRESRPSDHGPGLVRMLEWCWDPVAEREVCFNKDGVVYMTYDTKTKEYTYPNFSRMTFAGEQGLLARFKSHRRSKYTVMMSH
ncbi:MAG: hypothetical protein Q9215_006293 [Flavoplaca cf. flavocitrina]